MKKHRLYTPGPTPIPPEAQAAMAQPIDYHRAEPFMNLLREVSGRPSVCPEHPLADSRIGLYRHRSDGMRGGQLLLTGGSGTGHPER
ncbi:MAG: hypothetical protein KatS3mg115_1329 [Candidatus Poribacteria bacterium]|nr:MAG: hypothetical protein KatS3mg115_1329 [Candidatus Poribacteria bacterium]